MSRRWRSFFLRVATAVVVAWIIATVLMPYIAPHVWFSFILVPIIVLILICYLGKLLIDTMFYDHYNS
jgi:hypothetical protein